MVIKRNYEIIMHNLAEGVYFVDEDRKITYWSRGAETITGYKSQEVLGKHCRDNILVHLNNCGERICDGGCILEKTIRDGNIRKEIAYLHHKNGQRIPVSIRTLPLLDSKSHIIGGIQIFSDDSYKLEFEQRIQDLQSLALLDPLTEVGNRRYAEMILNRRFQEMNQYGTTFGLLFIDIDDFSNINIAYGHDAGDKALKTIARTITNVLNKFEGISRWGGEEFLAILNNVNEEQLYIIASKLRLIIKNSTIAVDSAIIQFTISIGATIVKPDDTLDSLLKRVDKLMRLSKSNGKDKVTLK